MKADVLLIHPPVNFNLLRRPIQFSQVVGYGLLHIATCLVQMGYKVVVWNLDVALSQGITPEAIQRSAKALDPSIVGIELNWVGFSRGAIQTAKMLKEVMPHVPVVLGGTHATIFAHEIMKNNHSIIDAVLRGEAEKTFSTLVRNLEEKGSMGEVGGLVALDGQQVREAPRKQDDLYTNIDNLPPYSLKVLQSVASDAPPLIPLSVAINTCRGPCRFNCVYCIGRNIATLSGRNAFSLHSASWIVNQISQLVSEGSRWFAFQDYLFQAEKHKLASLTRAIREEKLTEEIMGINMTAIPGILDRETMGELAKAGVYNIDYGIESGSDRILQHVKRPATRQTALDAVETTISEGILPVTWWMTGFPGEGYGDVEDTLDLINRTIGLGAIPAWITPLVIMPGTELFERAQEYGVRLRLRSFEDFALHSDLEMKAVSWYPEAMSHETEHMNRYEVLRATLNLKLEVFKRREEIVANFMTKYADKVTSRHPQITPKFLENQIHSLLGALLVNYW